VTIAAMVSSNELMEPGTEIEPILNQVHYVQPHQDTPLKGPGISLFQFLRACFPHLPRPP
jgi:hypothetical protein